MQNLFSPLIKVYEILYLFAYDVTGNFGLSLIMLSFLTFIVLYPFNKKAQQIQNKEHKIQTVLAPQIEKIKRMYSGREQYENLQWLYQRYSYHPLYAIRSALGLFFQ
jgi:membrane protein insertase Oxa1/YidC/SpoIIIJ